VGEIPVMKVLTNDVVSYKLSVNRSAVLEDAENESKNANYP